VGGFFALFYAGCLLVFAAVVVFNVDAFNANACL
jgi:hypothetical protein